MQNTIKKVYKKIFWVESKTALKMTDKNLVMCGTKNWEYYYSKIDKIKNTEYEEMKNVELVEFENEKEMVDFWEKLEDFKKIDWSLEHNVPMVLKTI